MEQQAKVLSVGPTIQHRCMSQQHCADMVEILLTAQKQCRSIQEVATLSHLLPMQQCYKQIMWCSGTLIEQERCRWCCSMRIRQQIQEIFLSVFQYFYWKSRLLRGYDPGAGDLESNLGIDASIIERYIQKLQSIKQKIVFISLYCRKGPKEYSEVWEEVKAEADHSSWAKQLDLSQINEKIQKYKDSDPRPAVSQQNCPTFNHLPSIISHIVTSKSCYQNATKPLTSQDRQSILEQVQIVTQLLQVISDRPKCSKCRSYCFEYAKSQMSERVARITLALLKGSQQEISDQIESSFLVYWVQDSSCRMEKQMTWEEEYQPPVEKVKSELVSAQQCSTRKQARQLDSKLQKAMSLCHELAEQFDCQKMTSFIDQEIKSFLPLLEQYVLLPKCKKCHSDRSRVERELLRWNCDRFLNRQSFAYLLEDETMNEWAINKMVKSFGLIAEVMGRLIRWCQGQG